jgi:hypothetical protein
LPSLSGIQSNPFPIVSLLQELTIMSKLTSMRFGILVAINVLGWCVLSFLQATNAQTNHANGGPNTDNLPFANSVVQRFETNLQLKEINEEIKAANALLRSGKLHVVVTVEKKP